MKNLDDGFVEIYVIVEEENLNKFIDVIKKGLLFGCCIEYVYIYKGVFVEEWKIFDIVY